MTRLLFIAVASWLACQSARADDVFLKGDAKDAVTVQGLKLTAEVRRDDSDDGPKGSMGVVLQVENVGPKPVTVRGWYYGKKDIEAFTGRKINSTGAVPPENTDATGVMLFTGTGETAKGYRPWMRIIATKDSTYAARSYAVKPQSSCKVVIDFPPVEADVFHAVIPGENLGLKDVTLKVPFIERDINDRRKLSK